MVLLIESPRILALPTHIDSSATTPTLIHFGYKKALCMIKLINGSFLVKHVFFGGEEASLNILDVLQQRAFDICGLAEEILGEFGRMFGQAQNVVDH